MSPNPANKSRNARVRSGGPGDHSVRATSSSDDRHACFHEKQNRPPARTTQPLGNESMRVSGADDLHRRDGCVRSEATVSAASNDSPRLPQVARSGSHPDAPGLATKQQPGEGISTDWRAVAPRIRLAGQARQMCSGGVPAPARRGARRPRRSVGDPLATSSGPRSATAPTA